MRVPSQQVVTSNSGVLDPIEATWGFRLLKLGLTGLERMLSQVFRFLDLRSMVHDGQEEPSLQSVRWRSISDSGGMLGDKKGDCDEGSQGGSPTLANDGFDTLVLIEGVAMSDTNGNEGCRARNRSFAETK